MSDAFNPYAEQYANPKGPGDARPTALQIIRDNDLVDKWTDKVVLVTGATSGYGVETARALYSTGARVFITARDLKKAQAVIEDIRKSVDSSGKLEIIEMDMNSLDSVKKAAESFLSNSNQLNVLINNAGIMATPEGIKTLDGHDQQFGVNHLAHYTLTALLLPTLLQTSTTTFNSRIISLTSSGHRFSTVNLSDINLTKTYNPWLAYGQSKTANIWLANHIDRLYGPRGVHALSVHPGGAVTGLQRHLVDDTSMAGFDKHPAIMTAEQGAATTVWAATSKVWEGMGGRYLTDCKVGREAREEKDIFDPGFAGHAFDEGGERGLWELSGKLSGVQGPV